MTAERRGEKRWPEAFEQTRSSAGDETPHRTTGNEIVTVDGTLHLASEGSVA
jgi:hypothetical protein